MFRFEKLDIWQRSRDFVKMIYQISQTFPATELYGLTSQIRRAAISVSLNIAEGAKSGSDKEFNRFLYMASRSLDEVVACLYLAKDIKLLDQDTFNTTYQSAEELGKMISGFKRAISSPAI